MSVLNVRSGGFIDVKIFKAGGLWYIRKIIDYESFYLNKTTGEYTFYIDRISKFSHSTKQEALTFYLKYQLTHLI